ncbi:MAG: hypothetical protein KJO31_09365 [Gammaproteobacteria bacterium]|nr:hypothetical protein [Gammaproteobacteria bacterium]
MSAAKDLLARSGQTGKFMSGFVLVLIGGAIVFISGLLIGRASSALYALSSSLGVAIGLGGFVYLCVAIRCPDCGAKWIWLMASKRRGDPLHWGWQNAACPVCGYAG